MRGYGMALILGGTLLLGGGLTSLDAMGHRSGHGGHHGMMHHGGHHGHSLKRMLKALDLSAEQKAKAHELLFESRKQAIALGAELRVARLELRQALVQDEVDRAAIDALVDRIGQSQQKLLQQRVDMHLKMHAILTPEQRAKTRTLFMDHLLEGGGGAFHRGGGPKGASKDSHGQGKGHKRYH